MTEENKKDNTKNRSTLTTGLLLIVVVLFLFNFNYDVFKAGADVGSVFGEGTGGYIAKWVTPLGMSGTLIPPTGSCEISSGQSSCTTPTLTWVTVNPLGTSAVTSTTGTPSPVNGNSGSRTFTAPRSATGVTFYLYNNAVLLAQSTITTDCVFGTAWNGSACAPGEGSIILTASPMTINTNGTTILEWACPSGTATIGSTNFATGGQMSGTLEVHPTATTVYTVRCDGTPKSVTVSVRRQPIFTEE